MRKNLHTEEPRPKSFSEMAVRLSKADSLFYKNKIRKFLEWMMHKYSHTFENPVYKEKHFWRFFYIPFVFCRGQSAIMIYDNYTMILEVNPKNKTEFRCRFLEGEKLQLEISCNEKWSFPKFRITKDGPQDGLRVFLQKVGEEVLGQNNQTFLGIWPN